MAVALTVASVHLIAQPRWLDPFSGGDQLARRVVAEAAVAESVAFAASSPPAYVSCRGSECEPRLRLRLPPRVYLWIEADGDRFVGRAMHAASTSVWVWEDGARAPRREGSRASQRAARAAFLAEVRSAEPTPAPASTLAVDELIEAVRGGNAGDRMRAAIALRQLGPSAAAAVPALIDMLGTQDSSLQAAVGNALLGIGPRAALPPLMAALHHPNRDLAGAAAFHIGSFGAAARPAVPALLQALRDPDLRDAASAALEEIEKES